MPTPNKKRTVCSGKKTCLQWVDDEHGLLCGRGCALALGRVQRPEEAGVDVGRLVNVGHGLHEQLALRLALARRILGLHAVRADVLRLRVLDAERGHARRHVVLDVVALRGHQRLVVPVPGQLQMREFSLCVTLLQVIRGAVYVCCQLGLTI